MVIFELRGRPTMKSLSPSLAVSAHSATVSPSAHYHRLYGAVINVLSRSFQFITRSRETGFSSFILLI